MKQRIMVALLLTGISGVALAQEGHTEQGAITEETGAYDYIPLQETITGSSASQEAFLQQVQADGAKAEAYFNASTRQMVLTGGGVHQSFLFTAEERDLVKRRVAAQASRWIPVIVPILERLLNNGGGSTNGGSANNDSAGQDAAFAMCQANYRAAQITIQRAAASCAAAGNTFRLTSGGDACGAGVTYSCEQRTNDGPRGG